ncbi:MAG: PaaI family thioesterase [Pseudomonadota bacterium]
MTAEQRQRIQNSFEQQTLMTLFNARLHSVNSGEVEITAPVTDGVTQQQGFAHAGLTFAIGDSSAGYAALTLMGPDQEVLTTEMKINLLAPGQGERLIARGRVIKPGRRLIVVGSDVFAQLGDTETHIATMLGTMIPVDLSTKD